MTDSMFSSYNLDNAYEGTANLSSRNQWINMDAVEWNLDRNCHSTIKDIWLTPSAGVHVCSLVCLGALVNLIMIRSWVITIDYVHLRPASKKHWPNQLFTLDNLAWLWLPLFRGVGFGVKVRWSMSIIRGMTIWIPFPIWQKGHTNRGGENIQQVDSHGWNRSMI